MLVHIYITELSWLYKSFFRVRGDNMDVVSAIPHKKLFNTEKGSAYTLHVCYNHSS